MRANKYTSFWKLSFSILCFLFSSCNHNNKKKGQFTINKKDTSINNTVVIKQAKKIADWPAFWAAFKGACLRKDTSKIIELTSFPFFQNGDANDSADFKTYYVEEFFVLTKDVAVTAISVDSYALKTNRTIEKSTLTDITELRTVYYPHLEIYFAKIKGYYKLVSVITPG